jgi:hypothetical protein
MSGIACPTETLCVATDTAGNVVTSRDPTGVAARWTTTQIDGTNALGRISCPRVFFCAAIDNVGNVATSTNPTGGPRAWPITHLGRYGLSGISCPSASLCVAVDEPLGNVVIGTPAVPAPQLKRLLLAQLSPSGKAAKIAKLLNNGGFSLSFRALTAGRLVISWYLGPKSGRLVRANPKPVLFANGSANVLDVGAAKIRIKLTRAGTRGLRKANHLTLAAIASFTPPGTAAVVAVKSIKLRQ